MLLIRLFESYMSNDIKMCQIADKVPLDLTPSTGRTEFDVKMFLSPIVYNSPIKLEFKIEH